MPVSLPVTGTVSYNGYTFGALTETVGINSRAVWDSAGRTIIYVTHRITMRTVVATVPPVAADTLIPTIRQQLMAPAKPLVYSDKGWGEVSINTAQVKDVAFGPKPLEFNWRPIGSKYAVEVVWTVETSVPECTSAVYQNAILEANFKVTTNINSVGLTRRTFSGFIQIAMTRNGNNQIPDTADKYREKFIPIIPNGFRRLDQTFELSEDKAREDVMIVDEEWPSANVPPVGCIDVSLKHSLGNAGPKAWTKQVGRMNAVYTVARGFPPVIAVIHFLKVVDDRVMSLFKQLAQQPPAGQPTKAEDIYGLVPLQTTITEEDAFGVQRVAIDFSYVLVTAPTLFMRKTLWRPIPGVAWQPWVDSMGDILNPRGTAGLVINPSDDTIVDLCSNTKPQALKSKSNPFPPGFVDNKLGRVWPTPPAGGSWIEIQSSIRLEPRDAVLRHVPLQSSTSKLRTPAKIASDNYQRTAALPTGSDKPVFQTSAATMPTVIFRGFAVRAAHAILAPVLKGAYGKATVPANREGDYFETFTLPLSGPVPINFARWCLTYYLSDDNVNIPGGWQANVPPQPPAPNVGQDQNWPVQPDGGWVGVSTSETPMSNPPSFQ